MSKAALTDLEHQASAFGLSLEYWQRLSPEDRALYARVRPMRSATYTVQHRMATIERTLEELDSDARQRGGALELNPDFQRGHVWNQDKQIAFMEAVLRGNAPLVLRFNCPSWDREPAVQDPQLHPGSVLCIDGLQRLTAMRDFVAGKFPVFGDLDYAALDKTAFSLRRTNATWTMQVFDIPTRAQLLQFYLDINAGGVVHAPEELARVAALRDAALAMASAVAPGRAPRQR